MTDTAVTASLAQNRAEELGPDVWDRFVIPPFYPQLNIDSVRKPRIFIGGRGCGKTMLLRYLSHQTAFSPRRPRIPDDELQHVGLYWRADTQFAHAMTRRGIEQEVWQAAFLHMAALVLGREVLASIRSIASSSVTSVAIRKATEADFGRLSAFDAGLPSDFGRLEDYLERELWHLETWVNNVKRDPAPHFLPGDAFVRGLLRELRRQVPALEQSVFYVYIDEYENLLPFQQETVNTWLKHSEMPLIFNVAMKRNAFETRDTVGLEALSAIHDFRPYDLEALDDRFELFAAEILFMRLASSVPNVPVDLPTLRDRDALAQRRAKPYVERVLKAAERLFPQPSHKDLANEVLTDSTLRDRLNDRIRKALDAREVEMPVRHFLDPEFPEASVIAPVLLRRRNLAAAEVAVEFRKMRAGEDNRLTGRTGWIHNNFIGALLQLYEPLSRPCPVYAGFGTYTLMAHGNLRHFIELCYKALARSEQPEGVSPVAQAEAARQASAALLAEVKSFGRYGNQLYTFVLRLGSLLALAHARPSQSEPEQTHFAIVRGRRELEARVASFLREAVKWSVLFEEPSTKKKTDVEPEGVDYILNPIYAPYFHISYRKKRRLELATDDIAVLVNGSFDDMRTLLRRYSSKWHVDSEQPASLFAHLVPEAI
jgi:hypothetical protein